jgi:hypothetical protein
MSTRSSERKQVDPGAAESVNAGRPGGSNLGNAALASLSIGDVGNSTACSRGSASPATQGLEYND